MTGEVSVNLDQSEIPTRKKMKFWQNIGKRAKYHFAKQREQNSSTKEKEDCVISIISMKLEMMHDPERDLLRSPCFYWPDLDSSSSAKLIKNKPDGVYIVRKSSHPEFRYTVTYKRAGRVASTRIQYNEESKLYSFNFASDYLPKKCTIRELLDAVAGQSIRMRREDSEVEVTFDMTLHAPVCRTLTLMEQCREKLLQLNPSQADIDGMERVLPKGLIQYLRER